MFNVTYIYISLIYIFICQCLKKIYEAKKKKKAYMFRFTLSQETRKPCRAVPKLFSEHPPPPDSHVLHSSSTQEQHDSVWCCLAPPPSLKCIAVALFDEGIDTSCSLYYGACAFISLWHCDIGGQSGQATWTRPRYSHRSVTFQGMQPTPTHQC